MQRLRPHHRVAREVERADLVALAFGDRNAHVEPARLLVGRVAQHPQLGGADDRLDVAAIAIVFGHLRCVIVELRFLVVARSGDEG